MAHKAPGRHYRKGVSLVDVIRFFSTEKKAVKWFTNMRWKTKADIHCPRCGSYNIRDKQKHPTMPYRCTEKECGKYFSVRTGTVLEASNIPLWKWGIAMYLFTTGIKGNSSMKLHRDIEVTQKTAWFMLQRIREIYSDMVEDVVKDEKFAGGTEFDETAVGGKAKFMSRETKERFYARGGGTGFGGKEIIVGAKNRETGKVVVKRIDKRDKESLQGFVKSVTQEGARVYTDEAKGYKGVENREHSSVNHSAKKYVDGMAHVAGMESFWSLFKRGIDGTYHKVSPKHVDRFGTMTVRWILGCRWSCWRWVLSGFV